MPYTIDSVELKEPIKCITEHTAVSAGFVNGVSQVTKFGYNQSIDSAASETIWAQGGTWQPTTGAETVNISSTSTQDTNITGTGAWLIAVFGVGDDYSDQSELTIALDGTNTVTTSLSYRYINRMAIAYSGSGRKNAGLITAVQSSSGQTLATIPIGDSITEQAVYTVPKGYNAYLKEIFCNVIKTTGGGIPTVQFRFISYNNLSLTEYNVKDIYLDAQRGNSIYVPQAFANLTAEGNTVRLDANTDTNGTRVFGSFTMVLVKT